MQDSEGVSCPQLKDIGSITKREMGGGIERREEGERERERERGRGFTWVIAGVLSEHISRNERHGGAPGSWYP